MIIPAYILKGQLKLLPQGLATFSRKNTKKNKNEIETIRQNDLLAEICDDHSTERDSQFSKFTTIIVDDTL